MEVIGGAGARGQPLCVVDYAHTPQAVEVALAALRTGTPGRLVVVLGAGGDRDREKRRGMGAAAAREADVVVVTDDNPRSEDPSAIRAALLDGARSIAAERGGTVLEIGDRRAAVAEAVRLAWGEPRGAVLVAGKGHEHGQEVGGTVWPFDDREVLREALSVITRRHGDGPGKPGR
jgi:UDP-N-acetylmuramoyl-L-alanyl-D-glutamate--2,6-diaminopimelate ligase